MAAPATAKESPTLEARDMEVSFERVTRVLDAVQNIWEPMRLLYARVGTLDDDGHGVMFLCEPGDVEWTPRGRNVEQVCSDVARLGVPYCLATGVVELARSDGAVASVLLVYATEM